MKKILVSIIVNCITFYVSNAQPCSSTEQLRQLPTQYKKSYSSNYMPTKEQEIHLTSIFSNAIEPALKKIKGFDVTWSPYGFGTAYTSLGTGTSPDGLSVYAMNIYFNTMRCTAQKKVTSKGMSNFELQLYINSIYELHGNPNPSISKVSQYEQQVQGGSSTYTYNKINNSAVYILDPKTTSGVKRYDSLYFYRFIPHSEEGVMNASLEDYEYFLITKKGIPFFIPVTIQQAVELSISVTTKDLEYNKKNSAGFRNVLTKAQWIKKEGVEPVEGVITLKQAEELNDAGYQGYLDGVKGANELSGSFTDKYEKSLTIMKDFLKQAPAKVLQQPAYATGVLGNDGGSFITDISELYDAAKAKDTYDPTQLQPLVMINPAYLSAFSSTTTPHFICIQAIRGFFDEYTNKSYKDFFDALDFGKLEQLLGK